MEISLAKFCYFGGIMSRLAITFLKSQGWLLSKHIQELLTVYLFQSD